MTPLASRVVARYLAANGILAEPGTTYVYQVDANNEVLYPGENVLVRVGEKLVRGEVILGNKSVRTEGGAQLPSLAVKAEDGNIYDATASSVVKLPQTIPTKRTVEASPPKFEFHVQAHAGLTPISKLFVDGQQLGLITSINFRQAADQALPSIHVGVLEGLSQESFEQCSDGLKKSAREAVAQLRRFPIIQLTTPEYL